jgi:hypothetical protein
MPPSAPHRLDDSGFPRLKFRYSVVLITWPVMAAIL